MIVPAGCRSYRQRALAAQAHALDRACERRIPPEDLRDGAGPGIEPTKVLRIERRAIGHTTRQ